MLRIGAQNDGQMVTYCTRVAILPNRPNNTSQRQSKGIGGDCGPSHRESLQQFLRHVLSVVVCRHVSSSSSSSSSNTLILTPRSSRPALNFWVLSCTIPVSTGILSHKNKFWTENWPIYHDSWDCSRKLSINKRVGQDSMWWLGYGQT